VVGAWDECCRESGTKRYRQQWALATNDSRVFRVKETAADGSAFCFGRRLFDLTKLGFGERTVIGSILGQKFGGHLMQGQVNYLRFVHSQHISQTFGGIASYACGAILWAVAKGDLSSCGFQGAPP